MSEMSMFDYISGITIGSIAAECYSSWFEFFRTAYSYDCLWATNGFSCFYYGKKYEDTAFLFLVRLIFCLMMGIYMKEILRKDILICPNFLCNAV